MFLRVDLGPLLFCLSLWFLLKTLFTVVQQILKFTGYNHQFYGKIYFLSVIFNLCSGVYDILVGGQKVGAYDSRGSFGELALMYNMPRAATIIATTTGTLWAMVSQWASDDDDRLVMLYLNVLKYLYEVVKDLYHFKSPFHRCHFLYFFGHLPTYVLCFLFQVETSILNINLCIAKLFLK